MTTSAPPETSGALEEDHFLSVSLMVRGAAGSTSDLGPPARASQTTLVTCPLPGNTSKLGDTKLDTIREQEVSFRRGVSAYSGIPDLS